MNNFMSRCVRSGCFDSSTAVSPETAALDIEVPLFLQYQPVFSAAAAQDTIFFPGNTISGLQTHSDVGPLPE